MLLEKYPKNIIFSTDYKKVLKDENITSVAIATPAKTHYKLVREALIAKKKRFCRKATMFKI